MITLSYDAATGIVTSTSRGLLTVEDVHQARDEIRALLLRARQDTGLALYLVDARATVVQTREVMEQVERDGSHLSHPNDRMAVVLPSALTGMQTRRVFSSANEHTFDSMDDAIAWLKASVREP